jgi:hypothetical protein
MWRYLRKSVFGLALALGMLFVFPASLQIIPAGASLLLHTDVFVSESRISSQLSSTPEFVDALYRHTDQVARGGPETSTQTVRVDLSIYGVPYFWDDWRIHFETRCKDRGESELYTKWERRIDADLNAKTNQFLQGQCETAACGALGTVLEVGGYLQRKGILHTYSLDLEGEFLHTPNPEGKEAHEVGVDCTL